MPKKLKVHSGTKDRIKVTKSGKLQRRRSYGNHFLQKKTASRKRSIASTETISGKTLKTLKRRLGV